MSDEPEPSAKVITARDSDLAQAGRSAQTEDHFDLLKETADSPEQASPYADTRDYAESAPANSLIEQATQSVLTPMLQADLDATGKSNAIDRVFLEAQRLVAAANLPAAVPELPAREPTPRRSPPAPVVPRAQCRQRC